MKIFLFKAIGIISVLMLSLGIPLSIVEYPKDKTLFYMWLIIRIIGFLGLCVEAFLLMMLKKKINTPREKEIEK